MSPTEAGLIRVLFVEDAFDQALLVRTFLQSAQRYEVTHLQDGDRAAELLVSESWDVLITDLSLPGTDGFHLIRLAKGLDVPIPALATTMYTASHYIDAAFRAGADDVMRKPLNRDEFLTKVHDLTARDEDEVSVPTVLALGGLPGDVEMGCGGTLVRACAEEKEVIVLPLCRDETDTAEAGLDGARAAGEILGVRVIINREGMDDTAVRMSLVERIVRDLRPSAIYMPALDDEHPARREAFRIGKIVSMSVPMAFGYQTASTGFDFRPTRFVEIREQIALKMEALAAYHEAGAPRIDLSPRLVQAYARYWGRFDRFREVEPFEIVGQGNP